MADSRLSLPSSSPDDNNPFQLPSQYKFLKVLGEGGFGKVLKCWKKDTKQLVAVKVLKSLHAASKEVSILNTLMCHNLDQCNIVKFFDSFKTSCGKALVFEVMDISIEDYILKTQCAPMLLSDIKVIIQQVATALNALKSMRVIHTDIKPDNIMLEDHQSRPFRVKLIDFGLATPKSKTRQGMNLQTLHFRSPEIILGLPFSEAIDMWSLGCMMVAMLLGSLLFRTEDEYETLRLMVELLGQPADHLLNEGIKTKYYFNWTDANGWRLKTPQEYSGGYTINKRRSYRHLSLDDLNQVRQLRKADEAEANDLRNCIELLKAMLTMDEAERITPSEVLTHPFIAEGHHNSCNATASESAQPFRIQTQTRSKEPVEKTSFDDSLLTHVNKTSRSEALACLSEHFDCDPPAPALKDDDTTNIHLDQHSSSPTIPQSQVIMVRPATANNRMELEDQKNATSLLTHLNKTSRSEALACLSEHFDCDLPAPALKDDDTTNIHLDHHSLSPTIPQSQVIMVRPATANNRMELEDQENATSLLTHVNKTSRSEGLTCLSEHFDCDPPAPALKDDDTTKIHPDHLSPCPTIPQSLVIMVLPATANNRMELEDQKNATSLQAGLNKMSESSLKVIEHDTTTCICEDSTTCDDTGTTKKKQMKKKKKNCFRHFFSWMKKNLCCCWTCVEEDE